MISSFTKARGCVLVVMIGVASFLSMWTNQKLPLSEPPGCEKPAFFNESFNCEGRGTPANHVFLLFNNKLNLNQATVHELSLIPRLKKKTASEIIATREKLGKFQTYDQIDKIKGVGPKTLAILKSHTVLNSWNAT